MTLPHTRPISLGGREANGLAIVPNWNGEHPPGASRFVDEEASIRRPVTRVRGEGRQPDRRGGPAPHSRTAPAPSASQTAMSPEPAESDRPRRCRWTGRTAARRSGQPKEQMPGRRVERLRIHLPHDAFNILIERAPGELALACGSDNLQIDEMTTVGQKLRPVVIGFTRIGLDSGHRFRLATHRGHPEDTSCGPAEEDHVLRVPGAAAGNGPRGSADRLRRAASQVDALQLARSKKGDRPRIG